MVVRVPIPSIIDEIVNLQRLDNIDLENFGHPTERTVSPKYSLDNPEDVACWAVAIAHMIKQIVSNHLVRLVVSGSDSDSAAMMNQIRLYDKSDEPLPLFIERLLRHGQCSFGCYIVALIYMERLLGCKPQLWIDKWRIRRLFSTALLIATKFVDDRSFPNRTFAAIIDCDATTLNCLETAFLAGLEYRLYVEATCYNSMCTKLVQGLDRIPPEPTQCPVAKRQKLPGDLARSANPALNRSAFVVPRRFFASV